MDELQRFSVPKHRKLGCAVKQKREDETEVESMRDFCGFWQNYNSHATAINKSLGIMANSEILCKLSPLKPSVYRIWLTPVLPSLRVWPG